MCTSTNMPHVFPNFVSQCVSWQDAPEKGTKEHKKAFKEAMDAVEICSIDVGKACTIGTKVFCRGLDAKKNLSDKGKEEVNNVKLSLQKAEASLQEINHVIKYKTTKDNGLKQTRRHMPYDARRISYATSPHVICEKGVGEHIILLQD